MKKDGTQRRNWDTMKKLFQFVKNKIISFFRWVWEECKDWHTIVLLAIVCLVLGLPVWGGYLIGFVFGYKWAIAVATVVWAFWMLPGAPFFALSVSITLIIKRLLGKSRRKVKKMAQTILKTESENTEPSGNDEA